jgi:spore coat protein U-like protein
MKVRSWTALAFAAGSLAASAAHAGTATGTLSAAVRVNGACTVAFSGGSSLSFGQFDDLTATRDASTNVNVRCPSGQIYSIGISNGANFSGTRRMASGANFIGYGIYTDAARTTAWTSVIGTGAGTTTDVPSTMYLRIPTQTLPAAGLYTDTLTVTVSY